MYELRHDSLNASLAGKDLGDEVTFRGIQYAEIAERFALPEIKSDWQGQWVACTAFG